MKKLTLLKSMLLLCALVAGSGSVWAADVTVAHGAFAKTSVEAGWTSTGTGTNTTGCIIVGKDEAITSPVLNLTLYSKITITIKARRYGTLSGSKAVIQAFITESVKGTTEATSTSVANRDVIELTPTDEMTAVQIVFTCTNATKAGGASGGNGAGIGEITIKGTPKTSGTIKPGANYSTLTSAVGLDFTDLDLKAYIATEVAAGSVNMTQVNKVPAGTGLVLVGTAGTSYNVPIITSGFDSTTGNQMAGSASEATAVAEDAGYILKSGIFQPATEGNLPPGKAYLAIAVSAHVLNLDFGNGETTSIEHLDATTPQADGQYYNLAGQRVAQPTKGLYIVNGKKVVIK